MTIQMLQKVCVQCFQDNFLNGKSVRYMFYIHCSVHHYNCFKIITNTMTLMDYPLFLG